MKLVGIINEHSPQLSSKKYEDFKLDCNYENIEKILDYLEKGVPVAVTMHLAFSLIKEDSSIIGGIIYYTDGYWIWPNYISYYLKNVSIELPSDFIEFIAKNEEKKVVSNIEKKQAIDLLKL